MLQKKEREKNKKNIEAIEPLAADKLFTRN